MRFGKVTTPQWTFNTGLIMYGTVTLNTKGLLQQAVLGADYDMGL